MKSMERILTEQEGGESRSQMIGGYPGDGQDPNENYEFSLPVVLGNIVALFLTLPVRLLATLAYEGGAKYG